MRQTLRTWIADADTRKNVELFKLQSQIDGLSYQDGRDFDLYLALVGEIEPPRRVRRLSSLRLQRLLGSGGERSEPARPRPA